MVLLEALREDSNKDRDKELLARTTTVRVTRSAASSNSLVLSLARLDAR